MSKQYHLVISLRNNVMALNHKTEEMAYKNYLINALPSLYLSQSYNFVQL